MAKPRKTSARAGAPVRVAGEAADDSGSTPLPPPPEPRKRDPDKSGTMPEAVRDHAKASYAIRIRRR